MSELLPDRARLASLFAAMSPAGSPKIDIDAVAARAYADGVAAGRAEAAGELAPARTALAAARTAFDAAMTVEPERLRTAFVALVTALAEAVVMAELTLAPAVMGRLVDAALGAVAAGAVTVRAHPLDAALLDDVVADPGLPRGTVVVDGADFLVRDGLRERLAAICEELA